VAIGVVQSVVEGKVCLMTIWGVQKRANKAAEEISRSRHSRTQKMVDVDVDYLEM
jgi:hypothetical protein